MKYYTKIETGIRQGGVISPDLFKLNSVRIVRDLELLQELIIGGHNLNTIICADNIVLTADT